MAVDLGTAGLTAAAFALGGVFNAIVGAASAEYRSSRDEERASARAKRDRVRGYRLTRLRELSDYERRRTVYWTLLAGGLVRQAKNVGFDDRYEREPAWELLGSVELLDEVYAYDLLLKRHAADKSPISPADLDRGAALAVLIERAVSTQEERILRDEEPALIPADVVDAMHAKWWVRVPVADHS